jgi:hypothetical protein
VCIHAYTHRVANISETWAKCLWHCAMCCVLSAVDTRLRTVRPLITTNSFRYGAETIGSFDNVCAVQGSVVVWRTAVTHVRDG